MDRELREYALSVIYRSRATRARSSRSSIMFNRAYGYRDGVHAAAMRGMVRTQFFSRDLRYYMYHR